MALIKDLNGDSTKYGTDTHIFTQCYCKVVSPVDMGKESCSVRVDWWLSEDSASVGGKQPLHTTLHHTPGILDPLFQQMVSDAQGDLIKALYNWLKLQPEFIGAVDA